MTRQPMEYYRGVIPVYQYDEELGRWTGCATTPQGHLYFEGRNGWELDQSFRRAVDEHLKVRP